MAFRTFLRSEVTRMMAIGFVAGVIGLTVANPVQAFAAPAIASAAR